jgi:hypothetical protein
LDQCADTTAIGRSFASAFENRLLRLVQTFGNQVLQYVCRRFLRSFGSACGEGPFDLAHRPVS